MKMYLIFMFFVVQTVKITLSCHVETSQFSASLVQKHLLPCWNLTAQCQFSTETSPATLNDLCEPHTGTKQRSQSPAVPSATPRLYYRCDCFNCCFI